MAASMGPERKAPENVLLRGCDVASVEMLQWGRSERLRKTRSGIFPLSLTGTMLQWGRSERLRKTTSPPSVKIGSASASMGPERKAPENSEKAPYGKRGCLLQWGRSERLRKTFTGSPDTVANTMLQWGRSERLRKTLQLTSIIRSLEKLQWGRSERLRKTPVIQRLSLDRPEASMGPERKAPENFLFSSIARSN